MSDSNIYPGQIYNTSSVSGTPSYTCSCGNPATNINDQELFCSGCHFQYTVAKSSGRLEEWVAERKKKVEERVAAGRKKFRIVQEKYYAETQAQAQRNINPDYLQGMQTVPYKPEDGYKQLPEEKGWWKKFAECRAKQK
jgi:hypothetical protein